MTTAPRRHVPDPVRVTVITVVHEGADLEPDQRMRVANWLIANGIDAAVVPVNKELTIRTADNAGGIIHYWCQFRNAAGRKEALIGTGQAAMGQRTALLTVPLVPEREQDTDGHDFSHPAFQDPVRCAHCGTDWRVGFGSRAPGRCAGSPQAMQEQQTGREVRS